MSAHVLSKLLNELRKRDEYRSTKVRLYQNYYAIIKISFLA